MSQGAENVAITGMQELLLREFEEVFEPIEYQIDLTLTSPTDVNLCLNDCSSNGVCT